MKARRQIYPEAMTEKKRERPKCLNNEFYECDFSQEKSHFSFLEKNISRYVAELSGKRYLCNAFSGNAAIAQSVERFTRNEKVAGSIPACGSREDRFLPSFFISFPTFLNSTRKIGHALFQSHKTRKTGIPAFTGQHLSHPALNPFPSKKANKFKQMFFSFNSNTYFCK